MFEGDAAISPGVHSLVARLTSGYFFPCRPFYPWFGVVPVRCTASASRRRLRGTTDDAGVVTRVVRLRVQALCGLVGATRAVDRRCSVSSGEWRARAAERADAVHNTKIVSSKCRDEQAGICVWSRKTLR
jgi:hypothetical protein